jgi:uncharacterized membrane protein
MENQFTESMPGHKSRTIDEIISSGFEVNGFAFFRRGLRYFSDEFGIYVAFTLVYIALSMALSTLPVVGDLSGMLVGPPLVAGFACYFRLQSRNEYREFSSFFGGFRGGNWPSLVSVGISVTLSMALVVAIAVVPFFLDSIQAVVAEFEKIRGMEQEQAAEFIISLYNPEIGLAALVAALAALSVLNLFSMAPLFVVYRGYSAFQAIGASWKLVSKKYVSFLLFNILLWATVILGLLMCCVGLLAALPVYYLSLAAAYEEITGD